MKKIFILLSIIILTIFIAGSIAFNKINRNLQSLDDTKVKTIDLNFIDDGTYYGTYAVFPVKVQLDVVIKKQKINDIRIIKHVNGKGQAAEDILKHIIEEQTIDVDIIAGATYSSRVIQKAVENALLKK